MYSTSDRQFLNNGEIDTNKWYGMRFRVTNVANGAKLELFVDQQNKGQFELVHSRIDSPGSMPPLRKTKCNPSGAPYSSPGTVSFFRTDCFARVEWRDLKIRNI